MSIIQENLRYAHGEGYTDVCYSEDGENVITCGSDGDVRIWCMDEKDDPEKQVCIGKCALSVRQKDGKTYAATGTNDIQILTYPEGERDGVLIRATDPFNQIAICKNKNIAALAGEGMDVTIMDLEKSTVITSFKDLGGPCLSVALCPNATKVAAATGDGMLRIWNLASGILLQELSCFPKVNSFANTKIYCRLDFDPKDSTYLAYPEKNEVKLLNVSSGKSQTLTCSEVTAEFTVLQFSYCGRYLAAASVEGDFVIWNMSNRKVFRTSKHDSSTAICAIMWNPKENGEIAYTDIEGQFSVLSNCSILQKIQDMNNETVMKVDDRGHGEVPETVDENGFTENEVDFGDFIDEDAKEDNGDAESISKDTDALSIAGSDIKNYSQSKASSRSSTPRPRTPEVPLQPPFMPTSTPEHLDPRYLCWNEVGVVKCYGNNSEDEKGLKSIEVEFHDSSFHGSIMVTNFQDYAMGSVGRGALVVANNSEIKVIPLAVTGKEWVLNVEEHEEIVLVASSDCLVCFATANYLIRICSIFGTQRAIVSVPGPLVSMAAYKNVLLVAYHAGGVREKDQCIHMKLFKFEGLNVESHDLGSALGPESLLYWLGFTDLGTPGMMDSTGMLSLFPPKCNTWIPCCDTTKHRKSPGDGFFVTIVYESLQTIGGILCKGTVYPGFVPRPTVSEFPIEPPFAQISNEKSQMEMNLFAWSNLNISDTEKKFKQTVLKLFALACKNDLDQRAFELIEVIANQQVLTLAHRYTTKLKKKRLAEKLMELATRLQDDVEEDDEPMKIFHTAQETQEINNTPDQTVVKPKIGKLSLSKVTPRNRKFKKDTTQSEVDKESQLSNENNLPLINTQESVFSESPMVEEVPRNPFLKKNVEQTDNTNSYSIPSNTPSSNPFLKKAKKSNQSSPLSLSDKFAGTTYEKHEKTVTPEAGEKRKHSDSSDAEKPIEKQRKLDMFMFSKK